MCCDAYSLCPGFQGRSCGHFMNTLKQFITTHFPNPLKSFGIIYTNSSGSGHFMKTPNPSCRISIHLGREHDMLNHKFRNIRELLNIHV